LKAAALGKQGAVPLGRVGLKLCIDLTDTGNSLLGVAPRIGSLVGITFTHGKEEKIKYGTQEIRNMELQ
jgi:hypothetical protein